MTDLVTQLSDFQSPSSIMEGDPERPPTAEEIRLRQQAAPGDDALLPIGVLYQAGWEPLADGMARHARAQVRALARAGMPVSLRPLPITRMMAFERELDPRVIAEVGHLRGTSLAEVPIAIRQLVFQNANHLENVIAPFGARLAGLAAERQVYASTIVYTSWERSTVAGELVDVLNRCGQVWVPCDMNYDVFAEAGVDAGKLKIVPCPYDPAPVAHVSSEQVAVTRRLLREHPEWYALGETTGDARMAEEMRIAMAPLQPSDIPAPRGSEVVPDGKRFYAIGKWEPRKNYHALIGAFLQEFTPREKASLFIKTSEWGQWEGYPSVRESIEHWLADAVVRALGWRAETFAQRVRVVTKLLSEDKLLRLHRDNNIYVTCSHGEAWDLPAFDARCAGNRLVLTGYGGAADYAGPDDVWIGFDSWPRPWRSRCKLEPVHPGYGWEANAEWASVPVEHIRPALRHAQPPTRRVHPPELYGKFGMPAVGALMRDNVLELADQLAPGLALRLAAAEGFG